jgi:hypothetical protein
LDAADSALLMLLLVPVFPAWWADTFKVTL